MAQVFECFYLLLLKIFMFVVFFIPVDCLYLLWRLTGGLKRRMKDSILQEEYEDLRSYGYSDCEILAMYRGYFHGATMSVELWVSKKINLSRASKYEGNKEIYYNLSTKVDLRESKDSRKEIEVIFKKVFVVNPLRIKSFCCKKYSLPKALFLGSIFGGDPKCGGGIKYYCPPFFQNLLEGWRLRHLLKKGELKAFLPIFSKDDDANCSFDKKKENGRMVIYLGDSKVISNYVEQRNRKRENPLVLKEVELFL